MSTKNDKKLTRLLELHQAGVPMLASWLKENGISHDLQHAYIKGEWLVSFGSGAFRRPGDSITWRGALCALQKQKKMLLHVGGLTALVLHGHGHYVRVKDVVQIFSSPSTKLPAWFVNAEWAGEVQHYSTKMFSADMALTTYEDKTFDFIISTPERAMMECLYLAPDKMDLVEGFHLMEGLVNLQPNIVQELLETCSSIKVKRLFLYLAEKAKHQWLPFVELSKVDLGRGNRHLAKNGVFVSKYQLTLPHELVQL